MIWWYQSLIFSYTRLELFASYFRGHAMSKVVTALQDGVKLMELFGWSRKKKISLWLTNPGWWLSFSLHKMISIMSFFLTLFIPLKLFGLMSSTSCHGSCLSPTSKLFFLSHVIVPYCWHISPKLANCRVWSHLHFISQISKYFAGYQYIKAPRQTSVDVFLLLWIFSKLHLCTVLNSITIKKIKTLKENMFLFM